jgi:subtilisin-like proprotein convertase family protein
MHARKRHLTVLIASVGLVIGTSALMPTSAYADGPTSFSNSAAIAIPASGSPNQTGPASPYPSSITASGLSGQVSNVTATFNNLSHTADNDIDAMLVAPDGSNLTLMSDIGDPNSATFSNNATLTFADGAAALHAGNLGSGTYAPSGPNGPDSFPAPAPAQSSQTTFSGAFTGISPNGAWKLYVVDDSTGDTGNMAGGWSLSITTTVSAVSTSTTVSGSPNPSTTGSPVTFTANVGSGGSPVTTGSVSFSDDGTGLGGAVPLDSSGQATLQTSSLAEGSHTITATYSGATGYLTSNGSTTQVVDNATAVNGQTYCNTGAITVPSSGSATPYPSHVAVTGLPAVPTAVTASLNGLSHTYPADLDIMLVGPNGQNLEVLSDVGSAPTTDVDLTFADGHAAVPATGALHSGTYAPTNNTDDGPDTFPAPAPNPSSATTMSTFAGVPANGQWSLYVVDDASGDQGTISGGWCVSFVAATQAPTSTTVTAVPRRTANGNTVHLTGTVTSGGSPVSSGTVDFVDVTHSHHPDVLASGVPLDGNGKATYDAQLSTGRHAIKAYYRGTSTLAPSSGRTVALIQPVADAGGPYTITAGDPLTLDASGSTIDSTSVVQWELNGHSFNDANGVNPTLSWSDLQALGIQGGHTYTVIVRVKTDGVTNKGKTSLTVNP